MKLSEHTVEVLKNFATINQNLVIKEGNTLTTMSAMKNIVAKAEVEEVFPQEVAIYDLNEFLAALSLFSNPNLDFKESYVVITEEGSGSSLKYFYSDPSVVTTPSKVITMPSEDVKFKLATEDLANLKKAAGVIGAPDLAFSKNELGTRLTVKDKKNDTANDYSLNVNVDVCEETSKFNFFFKVENMKLLSGDYNVIVSSKNISYFKNNNMNIEYWVALEPESTYEV